MKIKCVLCEEQMEVFESFPDKEKAYCEVCGLIKEAMVRQGEMSISKSEIIKSNNEVLSNTMRENRLLKDKIKNFHEWLKLWKKEDYIPYGEAMAEFYEAWPEVKE